MDPEITGEISHDSNPTAPSGIDAMMAQLDAAAASGKTVDPAAPAAPVADPAAPADPAKPAAPAAAKPAAPAAPAKPAAPAAPAKPAAPAATAEPDWSKAPPKWYKVYEEHKAKSTEQIRTLEAKIKSLETKPFEAPGDARKLEALEKQLNELREESTSYKKQLVQKDYTKSDEYKRDFIEPANRIYGDAVRTIERLRVKDGDTERLATKADFDYIRSLPMDARRKAANEMFGDNAPDVLDFAKDISRLQRQAEMAVERHAEDNERTALEREGKAKQEQQQYSDYFRSALDGMKANEKWGKWFSDDPDDPEGTKIFNDGFAEIERISAQVSKLPMDQQAGYSAFYKASAAALPRAILANNRLTSENAALREELEKIRGTDPGADPKLGVQPAGGEGAKPKGIDAAAAVFDQA